MDFLVQSDVGMARSWSHEYSKESYRRDSIIAVSFFFWYRPFVDYIKCSHRGLSSISSCAHVFASDPLPHLRRTKMSVWNLIYFHSDCNTRGGFIDYIHEDIPRSIRAPNDAKSYFGPVFCIDWEGSSGGSCKGRWFDFLVPGGIITLTQRSQCFWYI